MGLYRKMDVGTRKLQKSGEKLIIELGQRIKTSQMAGAYENSCHYNKFRVGKVGR